MAVGGQGIDVRGLHVQRKRPQSLDGIHEKEAIVPLADLADGIQIGPKAAEILDETDGQKPGAGAGHLDLFQRIVHGKPFDVAPVGLQAQPGVVVSGEFLAKGDDTVARAPIQTLGNSGYALGGILDQRDLAAIGANQTCGRNSKALIGIQPPIVVERPELESILGQFLHRRGRPPG